MTILPSFLCLIFIVVVIADEQSCTLKSASNYYDISPLSKCDLSGYTLSDTNAGIFVLNICNKVSSCSGNTAVCLDDGTSCGDATTGVFQELPGSTGVSLTYTNGDSCGSIGPRKSIISLYCNQSALDPYIVFLSENPQCTYNFAIQTTEACLKFEAPQQNICPVDVFLVPHSHDDVGWLLTIKEYYDTQVKHILDTTVDALSNNINRKFIYVEQAYFTRWWKDTNTSEKQRSQLVNLLVNGQWEFVLGGWVMPDEAVTTYGAVIDQLTLGHQFLLNTFGVRPTKGWQIDPFGASSVIPVIYKLAGFDGHIIDRISNKGYYQNNRKMDFIWSGSPTLKKNVDILTEILGGNIEYCDWYFQFPFNNNPVTPSNVSTYGEQFVSFTKARTSWYMTPNILAEWGCDFQFQNATPMFTSMDKVIDWLQSNQRTTGVNVKYATLSEYFSAVKDYAQNNSIEFPRNDGRDFFTYYQSCWWTGYFSSRTELKGFVRDGESVAHLTESLFKLGIFQEKYDPEPLYEKLLILREANANAQHHDAVTGTSVPEVVQMYKDDIIIGMQNAFNVCSAILNNYVKRNATVPAPKLVSGSDILLNINPGQTAAIVLYNSLSWTRNEVIRFPVNTEMLSVFDAKNSELPSQAMEALGGNKTSHYILHVFVTDIPPLGYTTIFVKYNSSRTNSFFRKYVPPTPKSVNSTNPEFTIYNDILMLNLNISTARITKISNKRSNIGIMVDQNLFEYTSKSSGPYCFTPVGAAKLVSSTVPETLINQGPVFSEFYEFISPYARQFFRIYTSNGNKSMELQNLIEFGYDIGPLPPHKEVVTRFSTTINTGSQFYTDANGFQFIERTYEWSNGLNANFYPITYSGFIKDSIQQLSFITDRSHGAARTDDGQFEIMIHRNPAMTDLGNPYLFDTTEVYPLHRVIFESPENSWRIIHKQKYLLNFPVRVFSAFTSDITSWNNMYYPLQQFLAADLSESLHIQSLSAVDAYSNKALLRLVHIFAEGEDRVLSNPVYLDFTTLFSKFFVSSVVETTITGNQVISPPLLQTVINPSEIRTFLITISV